MKIITSGKHESLKMPKKTKIEIEKRKKGYEEKKKNSHVEKIGVEEKKS